MTWVTLPVTIPAGLITADLAWFPLYVDFATLSDDFFDNVLGNGFDIRVYAANGTTRLPHDLIWLYRSSKLGGLYVRTPVSAAAPTVVIIKVGGIDHADPSGDPTYGRARVWDGFDVYVHCNGKSPASLGATPPRNNRKTFANLYQQGTVDNGDGPDWWITLDGSSGYYRVEGLPNRTQYSLGVVGLRNPGATGLRTLVSYTSNDSVVANADEIVISGAPALVSHNSAGDVTGSSVPIGDIVSAGVVVGSTDRTLYQNGVAAGTGAKATHTRNALYIGAENAGVTGDSYRLKGAIYTAFLYNGVLPADFYKLEYALRVGTDGGVTPEPPIDNGDEQPMIYFAGTSIADVTPHAGSLTLDSTGSKRPATVLEAINIVSQPGGFFIPFVSALNEFYAAMYFYDEGDNFFASKTPIVLATADKSVNLVRFRVTSSTAAVIEVFNGSSYVTVASVVTTQFKFKLLGRLDMYFKSHASAGRIRIKQDGVTIVDFTGQTDYGQGDYNNIGFFCMSQYDRVVSSFFVSSVNTEGAELYQLAVSAAGSLTQWTGAYTAIDETGYNDADYIEAATAGLTTLVNTTDMGASPAGSNFDALIIATRSSVGITAPTQLEGVVRVGSTDYTEAPTFAPGPSLGPAQFIFDLNPATGLAWVGSEINAAQVGVKSAT